jgi:nucleoside-diphosphate-sugar epimerase
MAVNNKEHSVMDIVKIVAKKFGIQDENLIFDETKPKGQFRKPAKSDIPKDYQYINLEQGITETIEWFINNYKTLRK